MQRREHAEEGACRGGSMAHGKTVKVALCGTVLEVEYSSG